MAGPRSDARRRLAPALALLLAAALAFAAPHAATAQAARPNPHTQKTTMNTDWIDPPSFATAPIGTVNDHACIPPNHGSDDQLNIAAPARVRPQDSGALVIPVCAQGIIPVSQNQKLPRFVAVNTQTKAVYEGVAYEYKPRKRPGVEVDVIPSSRPPKGIPINPGTSVGTQFSTDLAAQVQLPKDPAVYEVYIESNGVRSNTVKIEVQAAK
ncbi:hypothetical protein [Achromobacter anxifer]|jgi:hypothetical protein|uniref:Uncharacterized protein n=1 Tax=Achromobacter anxifer TaxID=1287737 RepID=A0A6S7EUV7_9BURK|nr:hypothetical protein [Achromobacter anxifer]MDF8361070.1 hypothetical protein [Achromobacter anxifer]CAB3928408.1 hypothetical protein LMG26858_06219 [Achromobacter anxifer]CAB5511358.1 hypothetical protein LMG26857_00645 [Achromobacter anxifer]